MGVLDARRERRAAMVVFLCGVGDEDGGCFAGRTLICLREILGIYERRRGDRRRSSSINAMVIEVDDIDRKHGVDGEQETLAKAGKPADQSLTRSLDYIRLRCPPSPSVPFLRSSDQCPCRRRRPFRRPVNSGLFLCPST